MDKLKFHHLGVAVEDIEKMKQYISFFFDVDSVSETVFDSVQNAKLCMVKMADGLCIELVEGEKVKNYIKKRQFMYHSCYEVADIMSEISMFEKKGAMLVSEPKKAKLFANRRVAFLATEIGLVELIEKGQN